MATPLLTPNTGSATISSLSEKIEKLKIRFGHQPVATSGLHEPWKPFTLKFPFLAILFLLTAALIAALEYLHYVSKGYHAGGLVIGESTDDISSGATFLYSYLPTILAVVYLMIWTWVDLDVKRLEPWFRLSRPNGTTAEDSILLHYPFDFGPFVPFKAGRRRHWGVFICSSAALLVTYIIVPLQAAIFTNDTIQRVGQADMNILHELAPMDEQSSLLHTHFLTTAYGVSWLDQRMPPYSTKEYALLPFSPADGDHHASKNETWTATTQMYWSNVTCTSGMADGARLVASEPPQFGDLDYSTIHFIPIRPIRPGETPSTPIYISNDSFPTSVQNWIFDDGKGCRAKMSFDSDKGTVYDQTDNSTVLSNILDYIPFFQRDVIVWNDPSDGRYLSNDACSEREGSNKHKFLVLRSHGIGNIYPHYHNGTAIFRGEIMTGYLNFTALFCEPSYYTRLVNATVDASTGTVSEVSFVTEPEPLRDEVFNRTHFEAVIGGSVARNLPPGNISDVDEVWHFARLVRSNIILLDPRNSQMVGNTIAAHDPPYSNEDEMSPQQVHQLQEGFAKAHALLFSAAMSQLIVDGGSSNLVPRRVSSSQAEGEMSDTVAAIVYVRLYALIIEVILGVLCFCIACLWLHCHRQTLSLQADPGSISQVMVMVQDSTSLLGEFEDTGTCSKKQLQERVTGQTYLLEAESTTSPAMKLRLSNGVETGGSGTMTGSLPEGFLAVRPWQLSPIAGALSILLIGGATAAIVSLYMQIAKTNGIKKPTDDPRVLSFLENTLPLLFASLLEPAWILVNRFLCALQPFNDMRLGNATASGTIKARYTTVPPPLAIWRAMKEKHFLLALVCATTISINALAVSLGGLIIESKQTYRHPTEVEQLFSGRLSANSPYTRLNGGENYREPDAFHDHFYRFIANSSGEAPLPGWVDNDYYYLPFAIPWSNNSGALDKKTTISGYSAITRGFGFDLECSELNKTSSPSQLIYESQSDGNGSKVNLGVIYQIPYPVPAWRPFNINCGSRQFWEAGSVSNFSIPPIPAGPVAMETFSNLAPNWDFDWKLGQYSSVEEFKDRDARANEYCTSLLLAGWGRIPAESTGNRQNSSTTRFILCKPTLRSGTFNVTVSPSSTLLSAERLPNTDEVDMTSYEQDFLADLGLLIAAPSSKRKPYPFEWHSDTRARHWLSSALMAKSRSNRFHDPKQPLPSAEEAIAEMRAVYRSLGALYMSFDTQIFLNPSIPTRQPVDILYTEERIFMKPVMFWISVGLLALQIMTLFLYCMSPHKKFLPRMPITIASTIADVAASHATRIAGTSQEDRMSYAYGRFKGANGASYVGIEDASVDVTRIKSE